MNLDDLEIIVKALVLHNNKNYTVDLTARLSDRAFGEITDLIEEKLS